jgi:hypothetical protein
MRAKQVHLDILKRFGANNPSAQALFGLLATRPEPAGPGLGNVDHLQALLLTELQAVVRRGALIAILRKLAEEGCGRFAIGRRGQPSRLIWSVSPVSLARAIVGKPSGPAAAADKSEQVGAAQATAVIEHTYRLRQDFTVSVSLPANLKRREAQRLGDFVRTLSFEEGPPEGLR